MTQKLSKTLAEHWRDVEVLDLLDGAIEIIQVPGGSPTLEAVRELDELRGATGRTPIMLGPPEEARFLEESFAIVEETAEEIIARSEEYYEKLLDPPEPLDPEAFEELRQRAMENLSDVDLWYEFEEASDRQRLARAFGDATPELDDWRDDVAPAVGMTIPWEILTKEPHEKIWIALLPVENNCDVFAHLRFGGWNACPHPHQHVAWWRYWNERHDARIVGITHDVVEAYVLDPPQTKEEATRLAFQQYAYCNDIVDQGTGTVEVLAATLLDGATWYFWWD